MAKQSQAEKKTTSEVAAILGRKRWSKTTPKQRSAAMSELSLKRWGTPEERAEKKASK